MPAFGSDGGSAGGGARATVKTSERKQMFVFAFTAAVAGALAAVTATGRYLNQL